MTIAEIRRVVSRNILHRMEEKGMSRKDLAARTGLNPDTVSYAYSGRHTPDLTTVAAIAGALDCEPWELLKPPEDRALAWDGWDARCIPGAA